MEQITLNYEASLVDSFSTCREYIATLIHQQHRLQKSIAADMDYSPSHLSRKCAQSPDDSMRFTLDDMERFMDVTGDTRPLQYLAAKYLGNDKDKIAALEAELDRLKQGATIRAAS